MRHTRVLVLGAVLATMLPLAGCGGIDFGDSPGPDVRKQSGPLTTPPADVISGKAR